SELVEKRQVDLVNPACFGGREQRLSRMQALVHFWARNFEREDLFNINSSGENSEDIKA
ncbi:unnamed protein product, partial [Amoebophrya sp. A25]